MDNHNTSDWLYFDETTGMIRNHIHAKSTEKAFRINCQHIRVDKSWKEEHEITTSMLEFLKNWEALHNSANKLIVA